MVQRDSDIRITVPGHQPVRIVSPTWTLTAMHETDFDHQRFPCAKAVSPLRAHASLATSLSAAALAGHSLAVAVKPRE